jgi:transposase
VRRGGSRAYPHAWRHRHLRQSRLSQGKGRSKKPSALLAQSSSSLPKYSPDLNPIEKFFAKLKHWLRKAAARTGDALCNAIADILPLTSQDECSNYFAQSGHTKPQTITP